MSLRGMTCKGMVTVGGELRCTGNLCNVTFHRKLKYRKIKNRKKKRENNGGSNVAFRTLRVTLHGVFFDSVFRFLDKIIY